MNVKAVKSLQNVDNYVETVDYSQNATWENSKNIAQ